MWLASKMVQYSVDSGTKIGSLISLVGSSNMLVLTMVSYLRPVSAGVIWGGAG